MAPPPARRNLRKDVVASHFDYKRAKPIVLNETGRPPPPNSTMAPNIRSISWSPTGSMVAHNVHNNIRVWNPDRADVRATTALQDGPKPGAHGNTIEKLAFSPRMESLLASTGQDGFVKFWDVRLPGGSTNLAGGGGGGGSGGGSGYGAKGYAQGKSGEYKTGEQTLFLTWHPSGTELLVGTRNDVITALDVRKADTPMILEPNANAPSTSNLPGYDATPTDRSPTKDKGAFYQMAFTNSGSHILAATTEGPVKVLSYPSMQPIHHLVAHSGSTYSVQQSPTGNHIAVGGTDGLITLWNTNTWLVDHTLMEAAGAVRDLSFSYDGAYLTAGGGLDPLKDNEKGLSIWHVETGEEVVKLETTNAVTWAAWHPLRHAVAYSGDPGGLKIVGGLTGGYS